MGAYGTTSGHGGAAVAAGSSSGGAAAVRSPALCVVTSVPEASACVVRVDNACAISVGDVVLSAVSFPGGKDGMKAAKVQALK